MRNKIKKDLNVTSYKFKGGKFKNKLKKGQVTCKNSNNDSNFND